MSIKYVFNYPFENHIKWNEINNWIKDVICKEEKRVGEITIYFVDDEQLLEINRYYLKHDYLTDVITFQTTFLDTVSGEVYISINTVKVNSDIYKAETFEKELLRVIIHGVLHLIGYTDVYPTDKLEMTQKENIYLSFLK